MFFFVFKQKTAYEMRISDWSSDVCSSDLPIPVICLAGDVLMKLAAVTGMVLDRRLSFSRPELSQRIFKAGRRGVLPGYRHACASLFCGSKACRGRMASRPQMGRTIPESQRKPHFASIDP